MNYSSILAQLFLSIWWIFPILFVLMLLKTSWTKGKIGEGIVNITNKVALDEMTYIPVKNVTLLLGDGTTTQIDHILVSIYGIFVIETKNMKGWIFGDEHKKEWTQQLYKKKHKFQNPNHQNYRHIKALEEVLGLHLDMFKSVVVFVGSCEFKTTMPENVFHGLSYAKYIRSFDDECLSHEQVDNIVLSLQQKKLQRDFKTDRIHVKNLNARKAKQTESCSKCGSAMVLRKNKKTNEEFLGCSAYPKCKNILK
jgi:hypothetical protein